MTLKEFIRGATKRERAELAEVCNNSVNYLYQLAGGHRFASALLARRIELATRRFAERHPDRFAPVPRRSLVQHPEVYEPVNGRQTNDHDDA